MRWFGESWGAPLCEATEHVQTPVGEPCTLCGEAIAAKDQGVVMPCVRETVIHEPSHRKCLVRAILGEDPVVT